MVVDAAAASGACDPLQATRMQLDAGGGGVAVEWRIPVCSSPDSHQVIVDGLSSEPTVG